MESVMDKIWAMLKNKKNVVGYNQHLKKRRTNRSETNRANIFRVYVSKIIPDPEIPIDERIPRSVVIGDMLYEIDIVEIGKPKLQQNESKNIT